MLYDNTLHLHYLVKLKIVITFFIPFKQAISSYHKLCSKHF